LVPVPLQNVDTVVLIAATGLEFGAEAAITTDRKFAKLGIEPVF
jgi:hypothetical protein